jgi:hypothetical protein
VPVIFVHGMGGLVTRSFVQRLAAHFPDEAGALRRVVTVNSPQGGMSSANTGVEYSPIVIPSWQDVAAKSGLCHHDPVASRARAAAAGEVTPPI